VRTAATHGLICSAGTRSKQLLGAWIIILTGLIGVTAIPGTSQATAGINNEINFQGRLLSASGAVVADGNYNMEFRIYQDGTGTAAYNGGTYASPTGLDWSEDWLDSNSQGVVVKNGYFSVNLGAICSLSGSTCQGESNSGVNWNDNTLWLSMDVAGSGEATANCGTTQALFHQAWNGTNGCSADGEMLPMRAMTSSVYAENAAALTGASGLMTASSFIQSTTSPQSGGANIDYVSAATGNIGAQIQSAASGTAAVLVLKDNTSSTGDLLQLQPSGSTTPLARFDDLGNLYVAGTIDTQASGGSLSIGPTNATGGITLQQNTSVASGKTLTVTAGATSLTGASGGSAVALTVHTGADSNKGLVIDGNSGSQSANLLELDNSSGVAQTTFDDSGNLTTNGQLHSGTTAAVGAMILKDGNANGYTVSLQAQNQAESYTLTLPTDGIAGTQCLQSTSGSTAPATVLQFGSCGSSSGANTSLSNLASPTAINQDLTFAAADRMLTIAQSGSTGNTLKIIAGQGASGSTGGTLLLQGGANGTSAGTPGSVVVKANGGDSTTAFQVQDASSNAILTVNSNSITSGEGTVTLDGKLIVETNTPSAILTVDPTNSDAFIGAGSGATNTTADLLVLDNQASGSSSDPTEVDGAMYYNTSLGAFRCGQGGSWTYCVNGPVSSVVTVPGAGSGGEAIGASNRIWVHPVYIPGPMTINDFYCDETTTLGSAGDIGLYSSSGSLLLDGGSGSLATGTGLKTVAPTQTGAARNVPGGQYYIAWTTAASTGAIEYASLGGGQDILKNNGYLSGGGAALPSSITLTSITASPDYGDVGLSN
jgi:hypothetical protein